MLKFHVNCKENVNGTEYSILDTYSESFTNRYDAEQYAKRIRNIFDNFFKSADKIIVRVEELRGNGWYPIIDLVKGN